MARKYHNLSGLVRDLEHAVEAGGIEEWKLLSTLANLLFEIEEKDPALPDGDESDSPDMEGDDTDAGVDRDGPDEGRHQLQLPGLGGLGADVPRGTLQRNSEPVPLVATVGRMTPGPTQNELRPRGAR